MAFTDRPYYRDPPRGGPAGVLGWFFYGSVPLFTAFGIRVRAHSALVIVIALGLLFGMYKGQGLADRVQQLTMLFGIILLHEFGHCFAARWTGGEADDILMTPLGGLALTSPRRRPIPTLITVLGGPAVNVILCVVTGLIMWAVYHVSPFSPGWGPRGNYGSTLLQLYGYLFWIYSTSFALLIFNMLPIYPMDGGQALQCVLWKFVGYYKATLWTTTFGIAGAVLLILFGVQGIGPFGFGNWLLVIALICGFNCYQVRQQLLAEGPWAFQEEDAVDYGASLRIRPPSRRDSGSARRAAKRLETLHAADRAERVKVDAILAKVSAQSMASLTWLEKRALRKATEQQRKRDAEIRKLR